MPTLECSLCNGPFDIDQEGGRQGTIGTFITVAFCPTCFVGLMDFAEQELRFYDPEYLEELLDGWKDEETD